MRMVVVVDAEPKESEPGSRSSDDDDEMASGILA
jgi:hypothetical protein